MRSSFNDATAAKKIKPDHLKALIRGQCREDVQLIHSVLTFTFCHHTKQTMTFGNVLCACAGAQCCIEVRAFARALQWCDEGLKAHPTDKKLLELRAAADKHKVPSLRLGRELEAQIPSGC